MRTLLNIAWGREVTQYHSPFSTPPSGEVDVHREVFVDLVVDPLRGLEPSPIKEDITGGFELHVLTAGGKRCSVLTAFSVCTGEVTMRVALRIAY